MSKLIITEEEKKLILNKYVQNSLLNEQKQFLAKLFGSSVDDIFKGFGDDAIKTLDDLFAKVFTKSGVNLITRGAEQFIKSASGAEIPMKTVKEAIELVGKGKLTPNQILNYLPRNLADGTEFRSIVQQSLESKGVKKIVSQGSAQGAKSLTQFETKNLLKNCFNSGYCDVKTILNNFYTKLGGVAKLPKFDPSKIKVLEKSNVAGREIINVSLEDGSNVLFYKSSGANVATTGKQSGEWFVIPGFAENGWFFKTQETINLTKGGNKYLTDMAEFLKQNGSNGLGAH
jgi:hypothetical protein